MEGDICGKTFLLLKTCQDKKLHNDFTKPCEMCTEGIRCERMDNYKGHSIVSKKPTATAAAAAAEKPTFDCVPCNKPFPKIHFLFVLSIFLPPRLLSSLSSLILILYPLFPTYL